MAELTPEEINDLAIAERQYRNSLLSYSDWTHVTDSKLTAEQLAAWAEYRQALRDITSQPDYPLNIVWPTEPTV